MAADALLEAPPSSQFVPGNKGVAQIYQQHHLNLNHFDRYIWEWRWGAGTLPNLQIIRSWKINGQSGTQRWCMDNLMRAYLDLHFADFLLSAITPFGHRRSPVCSSCREGLATVVSCNPFLHAGLRHSSIRNHDSKNLHGLNSRPWTTHNLPQKFLRATLIPRDSRALATSCRDDHPKSPNPLLHCIPHFWWP